MNVKLHSIMALARTGPCVATPSRRNPCSAAIPPRHPLMAANPTTIPIQKSFPNADFSGSPYRLHLHRSMRAMIRAATAAQKNIAPSPRLRPSGPVVETAILGRSGPACLVSPTISPPTTAMVRPSAATSARKIATATRLEFHWGREKPCISALEPPAPEAALPAEQPSLDQPSIRPFLISDILSLSASAGKACPWRQPVPGRV